MKLGTKYMMLVILIIASSSLLHAQFSIKISVESMRTSRAYLLEYVGTSTEIIDSTTTKIPGQVEFVLPENAHTGMYRLVVGPQQFLDFVFNQENVELTTNYNAPRDSLKVISSEENALWSEYMNFYNLLDRKQEYISRLLSVYRPDDPFYPELEEELTRIQQIDPQSITTKIIREHPDSYVARFLKTERSPEVPVGLSFTEELEYLNDHFFDSVDFNDSELMYSPQLMSKIQSFFGLCQQAYAPKEVESEMIEGINRLMSLAAVNDEMYAFLVDQIYMIFERSEFETFFAYFTETFMLDGSCKDEEKSQELEEVLAAIKKTEIGIQAPVLQFPLPEGKLILSELDKTAVLVLFWASWCPHCSEMMPEIKKLYREYESRGFEIIAISIDKDKGEYEKAIAQGAFPWINYSELKGWDCSIAHDYGIRATPTMIVVDKSNKIIAKPRNIVMLEDLLEEMF